MLNNGIISTSGVRAVSFWSITYFQSESATVHVGILKFLPRRQNWAVVNLFGSYAQVNGTFVDISIADKVTARIRGNKSDVLVNNCD